jgi:hypothetical protein
MTNQIKLLNETINDKSIDKLNNDIKDNKIDHKDTISNMKDDLEHGGTITNFNKEFPEFKVYEKIK